MPKVDIDYDSSIIITSKVEQLSSHLDNVKAN
jgi:hypothetical protein